jgi:hypothetical protein
MTDLITEAREQAQRRSLSLATRDLLNGLCDALEKAQEQNKQLMHEVCKLACESVERDCALAKLEAEVMARLEVHHEVD